MNSGFMSAAQTSDGADKMQRRWAKNSLQLLCRPLPILRATDVNELVVEYNRRFPDPSTRIPYRESTSCMKCHAGIDPMAALIRNVTYAPSQVVDNNGDGQVERYGDHLTMIKDVQPSLASEAATEFSFNAQDENFYQRPPRGSVRYRSFDGSMIWVDINATSTTDALTKMGQTFAESRDLYACAAKRYLEFFTGIDANLSDLSDPVNSPISAADAKYRDLAIQLGDRLQTHQSLRLLVQDILELDLYRRRSMR